VEGVPFSNLFKCPVLGSVVPIPHHPYSFATQASRVTELVGLVGFLGRSF